MNLELLSLRKHPRISRYLDKQLLFAMNMMSIVRQSSVCSCRHGFCCLVTRCEIFMLPSSLPDAC